MPLLSVSQIDDVKSTRQLHLVWHLICQSFANLLKLTSTIFKTDANYIKVGNLGTVLHETSRLLADQFDVEPSAVIAVSLQFHFSISSVGFIRRILVR